MCGHGGPTVMSMWVYHACVILGTLAGMGGITRGDALAYRASGSRWAWLVDSPFALVAVQVVVLQDLQPHARTCTTQTCILVLMVVTGLVGALEAWRGKRYHLHCLGSIAIGVFWLFTPRPTAAIVGAGLLLLLQTYEAALRQLAEDTPLWGRGAFLRPRNGDTLVTLPMYSLAAVSLGIAIDSAVPLIGGPVSLCQVALWATGLCFWVVCWTDVRLPAFSLPGWSRVCGRLVRSAVRMEVGRG